MAYSDIILAETSLQSYWRLDESAGATTIADSKGVISGTASGVVFGQTGLLTGDADACADFNGTTSGISCGNNYGFTGVLPFAVEFWMNLDDVTTFQMLLNKSWNNGANREGWDLFVSGGFVQLERWVANATVSTPTGASVAVTVGATFHVVATYDGTNSRVYVNAGTAAVGASDTRSIATTTSSANFGIGGFNGGTFYFVNGRMDEVAVYNAALSAQQVYNHYQSGLLAGIPVLVAAGTAAFTATNGATFTPAMPTGWAANDILVLPILRNDTTAATAITGWTLKTSLNDSTTERVEIWYRRAVGGDTAPAITMGTSTVVRGGQMLAIRGCPTSGDPFADVTGTPNGAVSLLANASGNAVAVTDVSPANAPTLALFLILAVGQRTAATTPTNYTAPVLTATTLGNDLTIGYAVRSLSAAGSAGNPSTTLTSTTTGVVEGGMLVFRPIPVVATAPTFFRTLLGVGR